MSVHSYPTWVEVNVSAIEHNTRYIVKDLNLPLMAVVKANAYGHGSVEAAKAALAGGAIWLAVARYGEARVIREAGIDAPLFVLGMVTADEIDEAIKQDVSLTMHSYEVAEMLAERARIAGKKVKVHLKVDTGMGRLGVLTEEALPFAQFALSKPGIELEGMYSHFATATSKNHPHIRVQSDRFHQAVEALGKAGIHPKWVHLSNSAATYYNPESYFNLQRAGSAVMGMILRDNEPFPASMRRAFTWKARLASCKVLPPGFGIGYGQTYVTKTEEIIGVVPVGYGDGYRRGKGNIVLIDGQRIPVVSRECMDQTMVRLPKKYPMGTEVVLIGEQGNESIQVEEVAKRWDTVEVDVTTSVNFRVPRIYVKD